MCIFTGPVRKVHKTRILVSPLPNNLRQLVVYENQVEQTGGVRNAMVLPVPSGQRIEFIDLSKYRGNLWDDCASMFPSLPEYEASGAFSFGAGFGSKKAPLPVQRVGGYQCTIVPGLEDFVRVSKDVFYLPSDIETVLREHYSTEFSFIVCLFEGNVAAHPIAYSSARLSNGQLFIPTRHAHGGGGATHLHMGGEVVHPNITCDACGIYPLIGARWKCSQCPDYDMCNTCYTQKRESHSIEHSFIHIVAPTQSYYPPSVNPNFGIPAKLSNQLKDDPDGFDHTLYLINCVLVASPSRYDTIETCVPRNKSALFQLNIPLADCISKVDIKGGFPNRDYVCVEIQ